MVKCHQATPFPLRPTAGNTNTQLITEQGIWESPIKSFIGSPIATKIQKNHAFCCPVYDPRNCLHVGGRITKWNPKDRIVLYLGPSSRYVISVSLIFIRIYHLWKYMYRATTSLRRYVLHMATCLRLVPDDTVHLCHNDRMGETAEWCL